MSCYQAVHCPYCESPKIIMSGKNATGTQRYLCQKKAVKRRPLCWITDIKPVNQA